MGGQMQRRLLYRPSKVALKSDQPHHPVVYLHSVEEKEPRPAELLHKSAVIQTKKHSPAAKQWRRMVRWLSQSQTEACCPITCIGGSGDRPMSPEKRPLLFERAQFEKRCPPMETCPVPERKPTSSTANDTIATRSTSMIRTTSVKLRRPRPIIIDSVLYTEPYYASPLGSPAGSFRIPESPIRRSKSMASPPTSLSSYRRSGPDLAEKSQRVDSLVISTHRSSPASSPRQVEFSEAALTRDKSPKHVAQCLGPQEPKQLEVKFVPRRSVTVKETDKASARSFSATVIQAASAEEPKHATPPKPIARHVKSQSAEIRKGPQQQSSWANGLRRSQTTKPKLTGAWDDVFVAEAQPLVPISVVASGHARLIVQKNQAQAAQNLSWLSLDGA